MSAGFLTGASVGSALAIAVLCYVLLYRTDHVVVQRSFFFRVGLGGLLAAVAGGTALLLGVRSTHLGHAVFAFFVAAAVRVVRRSVHPANESWFETLFDG